MKQVAIVTDSVACLTRELVDQYQIRVIPVNIVFQGKIYRDWVDITPTDGYRFLENDPEHFSTSSASPEEIAGVLRSLCPEHQGILCVMVSSRLSTLYNMARLAREQVQAQHPDTRVEVLDSRSATASEGFIALAAARTATEGKDMAEVIRVATAIKDRVKVIVVLETISYVYRTGRVPRFASRLGALLSVKPIISISDGAVHFMSAARTKHRAIEKMLTYIHGDVGEKPAHMAVMHANSLAAGQQLMERVKSEFNCQELWMSEFSPVMGYATGPGVVAIAYYCD